MIFSSKKGKTADSDIKLAFISTLPVMAGYIVLGIGLGFLMRSSGYGTIWSSAEAIFIYAGAMQYATVGLLKGGTSLLTAALTTLAVNARHLFYGISMLDVYRDIGKWRWYPIFALTDETYSILCDNELLNRVSDRKRFIFAVSLMDHIYWFTGCTLGGLLSSVVPSGLSGVDFALTALFVSAFAGQWENNTDHIPAIAGVGCTLLCLLVFGKERFLIPAMILITAVLLLIRRNRDDA